MRAGLGLEERLSEGVATGAFPGAQACVMVRQQGSEGHGATTFHGSAGVCRRGGPAVDRETLFDIASLTKVISTTTAAYRMLSSGVLSLEDPVSRWFPTVVGPTVRHLLAHTSGLPAWKPLFLEAMEDPLCGRLYPVEAGNGPDGASAGQRVPRGGLMAEGSDAPSPFTGDLPASPDGGQEAGHLPDGAEALYDRARRLVVSAAASAPLEHPPGRRAVYSDLGFILLGEILSRCAGQPLDVFFLKEIAAPLGLSTTAYRRLPLRPTDSQRETRMGGSPAGADTSSTRQILQGPSPNPSGAHQTSIASTGRSRPRPPARGQEGMIPTSHPPSRDAAGEVDDDNAWAMGGVAGHAGLFSNASDVAAWGVALLEEAAGAGRLGDPGLLRSLLAPDPHPEGPLRALGFDLPTGPASSAGTLLGKQGPNGAVGHLGFTGCSIWVDFDRSISVALLTNRVYADRREDSGIRAFRPAFHDHVIRCLEG